MAQNRGGEDEPDGTSRKKRRVETGRPTTLSTRAPESSGASWTDRLPVPTVLTIIALVAGAAYWAGGTREKVETQHLQLISAHTAPRPASAELAPPLQPNRASGAAARAIVTSPKAGARVSRVMLIEGKSEGIPAEWDVWLVTRREAGGDVFPKQRVTLLADGSFEKKIWDDGESGDIWVCVLIADASETVRFNEWIKEGDRTGRYPALVLHDDKSKLLTCQKLALEKAAHR